MRIDVRMWDPHSASRSLRTVRAGAHLCAVGQAPRARLVLVEVGVRHVERHSRLRPPDELAALHALFNDGPRHADVRHAAVYLSESVGVYAGRPRREVR